MAYSKSTNPCQCGCGRVTKWPKAKYLPGHAPLRAVAERFWEKVDIRGEDECWEWQAAPNPGGYGNFWLEDRTRQAHVIAFLLSGGVIHPGGIVLHSCDNRLCCNPHHLRSGTQKENVQDAIDRDRNARGERSPRAKLTADVVREIRSLYVRGVSYGEIGRRFGVTPTNVRFICKRRTWKHIE